MGIFTTILATIAVVAQLFDAEKMVITLLGSSEFCSINNDKIFFIKTAFGLIIYVESNDKLGVKKLNFGSERQTLFVYVVAWSRCCLSRR